ncbi:sodium-coupled monocarboxylate transporter 1-like [Bacillus rossius redtenbacheri]|uniref:sodium-coupled monocarboxylate transporter 1-like n=1 Tax=Bacillus rossius redtenbacheri TaxID=93214 RepID=UPI002FDD09CD
MTNSTIATHVAHFSWVDHTMFALMLVVSTVVGVLIGVCGKQDTKVDYLLGGKKMSVIPIAVSLIFSHISSITIVAVPTEYYTYGAVYFNQYISGFITCVISYYIFLPIFFDLQLTSTYEYLQLRFNRQVRTMASILFTVHILLYLPIVVYVPALAFNQVSGVPLHLVTSVVCGVCMLYTMLGGMKAVVWTDFLQSFVTVGSSITIIILGLINVGGFNAMWDRSEKGGRLEFVDFNPDPFARNTFWTVSLGTTFFWMSGLGVSQGTIQKFIALPSLKKARLSLVVFFFGFIVLKSICFMIGMLMYTTYYNCDPITSKQVSKPDQMLPYFTMDTASRIPGLSGLFVAGTFSAALSALSSNFNCLSATTFEDFISPWIKNNSFFENKTPLMLKSIVVVTGMICILLVFAIEKTAGIIMIATSASGITSGALLGMFLLGMLFPWANEKGCLVGSVVSLGVMAWIMVGAQVYKTMGTDRFPYLPMSTEGCEEFFNITVPILPSPTPLPKGTGDDAFPIYKISFHYYCLVGTATVLVVGLAVSYFTGFTDPNSVDARLLVPFVKKYGHSREADAQDPSEKILLNLEKNIVSDVRKNSVSYIKKTSNSA